MSKTPKARSLRSLTATAAFAGAALASVVTGCNPPAAAGGANVNGGGGGGGPPQGSSTSAGGAGAASASATGTGGGGSGGGGPVAAPWSKLFPGKGSASGLQIATDPAGNVLVAGRFADRIDVGGGVYHSAGWDDLFLVKLTAEGSFLWSKHLGSISGATTLHGLGIDGAGHVHLLLALSGAIDPGIGPIGGTGELLLELGADGSYIDDHHVGVGCYSMAVDPEGGVTLGCVITSWGLYTDFGDWSCPTLLPCYGMIHLAPDGTGLGGFVEGPENVGVSITGINRGPTGVTTLATHIHNDVTLTRFDATGALIAAEGYGDDFDQNPNALGANETGPLVLGAFQHTLDWGSGVSATEMRGYYSYGTFIAQISDVTGHALWMHAYQHGAGDDEAVSLTDIAGLSSSGVAVAGEFQGTVDIGDGVVLTSTEGDHDAIVMRLDANGQSLWTRTFGAEGDQNIWSVTGGTGGRVLVTGRTQGAIDFGQGPLVAPLDESGAFVAALAP